VNALSVQQVIEEALHKITREKVVVIGSGRTDTGVHAMGQVANCRTLTRIPEDSLLKGLNSLLPDDIAVKDLVDVDFSFHARHNARSKVYLYQIWNSPVRSPLLRNHAWFIRYPLDLDRMREAFAFFLGTHDFSSFCAAGGAIGSHIRTITAAGIELGDEGLVTISVEADGFLRYMVRNIVGTLVEVGKGRRSASEVVEIMKERDRRRAGVTAPPHGLFLKEVKYQ
jgi:tRNA pseudouridine38-40 synthase